MGGGRQRRLLLGATVAQAEDQMIGSFDMKAQSFGVSSISASRTGCASSPCASVQFAEQSNA